MPNAKKPHPNLAPSHLTFVTFILVPTARYLDDLSAKTTPLFIEIARILLKHAESHGAAATFMALSGPQARSLVAMAIVGFSVAVAKAAAKKCLVLTVVAVWKAMRAKK